MVSSTYFPQISPKKITKFFATKLSLAVVFVEYDRQDSGTTTSVCDGASDKVFETLQGYLVNIKESQITWLRVNNKHEDRSLSLPKNHIYTVGGDNSFREFSGWQKGVKIINTLSNNVDLVLFVNDMFLKPGASFLPDYADITLLKKSLDNKRIIGRIDSTGQHYTAYGYDVSHWVCTNCFLVPIEAINQLQDMVSVGDNLNDLLSETFPGSQNDPTKFFKNKAPINATYKVWLVEWLTERWHSKFAITEDTWELFRTKVRNILNESLLTARLAEIGFKAEKYGNKFYY